MYIQYEKVILDFYENLKHEKDVYKNLNRITAVNEINTAINVIEKLMDECEIKYEK